MWQFRAVEPKEEGDHKSLVASIPFKRGEIIFTLYGVVNKKPSRTSIKIADGCHIEDNFGAFINHSCKPSVKIEGRDLVAIKNLDRGEEITFDYRENEDDLVEPFNCKCCGDYIK